MSATERPPPVIQYLGATLLDRAAERRKDSTWLAERIEASDACFVPVWRNRNLVQTATTRDGGSRAVLLPRSAAIAALKAQGEVAFLGLRGETAVFAIEPTDQTSIPAGAGDFVDLRSVGQLMGQEDAAMLAYARGLMHWHRSHRFCSRCGAATESRHGGHMRACTGAGCLRESYPRTDPAVIMLVEEVPRTGKPRRCLLGRRRDWAPGVFSTLAGFVEPGESLEEAVFREVFEEAGVRVSDIRYLGSQPWPFPASLMLGFFASASETELRIDADEIEEARWFTAEKLRTAGEWDVETSGLRLPRRDSIARFLIESWLAQAG